MNEQWIYLSEAVLLAEQVIGSPSRAREKIVEKLRFGELISRAEWRHHLSVQSVEGHDDVLFPRTISAYTMEPIDPIYWMELEVDWDNSSAKISNGYDGVDVKGIHVNREQVDAIFSRPAPSRSGGAPTKYDWESVWLVITTLLHEEGPTKTQREFRDKVLLKMGSGGPGETELKRRVSRLWTALGLGDN